MELSTWLNSANEQLLTGLLIFVRLSALMIAGPVLGGRAVPPPVRVGLAGMIALILTPMTPAEAPVGLFAFVAAAGREAIIGAVLGWIASLFFGAVQMAGEWLDLHSGFQAAELLNPALDQRNALLGSYKNMLATLVFFGVGGHAIMLRATVASLRSSPPGDLTLSFGTMANWMPMLTDTIWIAVQIAAPVGAALFLTEIALALANRALPGANVMILFLPAKALLSLVILAMITPLLSQALGVVFVDNMGAELSRAVGLFGGRS
jgi:flagellar biosynthetic protein FliR